MSSSLAVYAPFWLLLLGMAAVIGLITVARLHAFVSLVLAGALVGLATPAARFSPDGHKWLEAMELLSQHMGETSGKIGLPIALASLIGMCLGESGAADAVVRRFVALCGQARAGFALLVASYVLSIPIFFDTFFMLLVPLAQALARRTGRDYLLYVMAICCGATVTHALIVPHPGPLAMAGSLHVDVGLTIIVGLAAGVGPLLAGWLASRFVARRVVVEVPAVTEEPDADSSLPRFWFALMPVLVPIVLIGVGSAVAALPEGPGARSALSSWLVFLGNRNVALLLGAFLGAWLLMHARGVRLSELGHRMGPPLETAGVIILITSAGGAFGFMLRHAGVGEAVQALAAGLDLNLVLLAWLVAAVIRAAQGSATVAMLTTAAMMEPLVTGPPLPYHRVYVFLAIGSGSFVLSWMNDSGFWVVSRLAGLSERQTLQSFTVVLTAASVAGLLVALLLSRVLPLI